MECGRCLGPKFFGRLAPRTLVNCWDCDGFYRKIPAALDLNDFALYIATPEQQQGIIDEAYKIYIDEEHQKTITPEVYQKHFDASLHLPFSDNNAHLGWVLARHDDPKRTAVSHVQTKRRPVWIKDAEGIRDATMYGVTFVQTPEALRRRGYSHRALRILHHMLAPHLAWAAELGPPCTLSAAERALVPPAELSILSSVAPPGFYQHAWIGPAENKRIGWLDRTYENGKLCFPLPQGQLAGATDWMWEPVYENDYPAIQQRLGRLFRRALEQTPVAADEAVVRLDPSHPGLLQWSNSHLRQGAFQADEIPESQAVGYYFYSSTETTRTPTDDTPLVLVLPHGGFGDSMPLNLAANISPDVVPAFLTALAELARHLPKSLVKAEMSGYLEDAELVKAIQSHVGGQWQDRSSEGGFLPTGVAWYGDEKTKWRMDGMELWTWH